MDLFRGAAAHRDAGDGGVGQREGERGGGEGGAVGLADVGELVGLGYQGIRGGCVVEGGAGGRARLGEQAGVEDADGNYLDVVGEAGREYVVELRL